MCRILVVDDHITSREPIVGVLENEGHLCAEASNGQEALDWLRAEPAMPCIILLDLRMPVMDGWDFLHALRAAAQWRDISVVVVSGNIEQDGHPPVLMAQAFWPKPLEMEKVRNLYRYCDRHRDTWKRQRC